MELRKLLSITAITCISMTSLAQVHQWAKIIKTTPDNYSSGINGVTIDAEGNHYVSYNIYGEADLDPSSSTVIDTSEQSWQSAAMLVKYDPNWEYVDHVTFRSDQSTSLGKIALDQNKNIICYGYFHGTMDLDPGSGVEAATSNGSADLFLLSLDSNMNYQWGHTFGGSSPAGDYSSRVVLDDTGNIYISGVFASNVDFDPGSGVDIHLHQAGRDPFFCKYTSNGTYQWTRTIGCQNLMYALDMHIANNELSCLITSNPFNYTADLDPGSGTYNVNFNQDSLYSFVWSIDLNGNFTSALTMQTAAQRLLPSQNGWILSGNIIHNLNTDLDHSSGTQMYQPNSNGQISFIQHIQQNGSPIWTNIYDQGAMNIGGIDSKDQDEWYVTSWFYDSLNLNPGGSNVWLTGQSWDVVTFRLDGTGSLAWWDQVGGSGIDRSYYVHCYGGDQFFIAGNFNGTVDFNSGSPTSNLEGDSNDIFISRYGYPAGLETMEATHLELFPNPASDKVNFRFNSSTSNVTRYRILDVSGKRVLGAREISGSDRGSIDISQLTTGIYLIEFFDRATRIQTSRLVVSH